MKKLLKTVLFASTIALSTTAIAANIFLHTSRAGATAQEAIQNANIQLTVQCTSYGGFMNITNTSVEQLDEHVWVAFVSGYCQTFP